MTDFPPDPFDPSEMFPDWAGYSPIMQDVIRAVIVGRQDLGALRETPSLSALSRALNAIQDPQQLRNVLLALMVDEHEDDREWWFGDRL